jgi:hypothetical protein
VPVDRLEDSLRALGDQDDAEGIDLTIGFLGGLSTATHDFHLLGMSQSPGKHLVVRAPGTADDFDAIDKAFNELSEDERIRLRRARAHHREVAVLLHEIGHALGAPHETDRTSLMNPSYDPHMAAYGASALAIMRAHLEAPTASAATATATQTATATATATATSTSTPAVTLPATPPPPIPPALAPSDAADYRRALAALASGDAATGLRIAKPLSTRYPDVLEVQDLRCKLAVARGGSWDAARAECEPLMDLTMKATRGK